MTLTDLLRRAEGKTLEFKRNLQSPQGALKTLVAFANTSGGTLLIGVEDRAKAVCGVKNPLRMEETVASLIADSIAPRLIPDLEILPWRDVHALAVGIHAGPNRPHYLVREGPERGVYVRVGSTNRRADAALIAEMRRYVLGGSFDEQPMPELYSEAIDFRVASEYFAPARKLKKRDLATLRILVRHQGRDLPTVGGMLLFGRERLARFPDAWIQAGRFGGKSKGKILDQAELRQYPITAIEEAIAFLRRHIPSAAEIGAVRRKERWALPQVAIREALINAVAHADYAQQGAPIRVALFDDRLEIENPGLLPFGLEVEDLLRGVSRLRNRVIGRVFHELGLIEQWGSGIGRMFSACEEAGLAPPLLEEVGLRFRVTLRMAKAKQRFEADATNRAILELLGGNGGHTTAAIARHIGLSTRATRTRLAALTRRGLVAEIGSGPRDPQRKYYQARTNGYGGK